jgi:dolichyldiphosphatase
MANFFPDLLIAHLGTGYGMPSSHSQFMTFFALQVILYTHYNIRLDHNGIKWFLYFPTVALAMLVMYSRVHLGYHTPEQVAVGSGIGIIYAVIWFWLTEYIRQRGLIDWLINLPICQAVYLRDARLIDNVAKWEYDAWKAKTSSLKEKHS